MQGVTIISYDALGRLTERRIALPVVADPVLTTKNYDEASTGYLYNVGQLTTSSNSAVTLKYNYSGDGVLQKQTTIDSAGTHEIYSGLLQSSPVFRTYTPGPLSIGTNAAR
jgi:hypothetical protein